MSTTQENMSRDCVYVKFEMKRTKLRAVSDSRKEDRAAQVLGITCKNPLRCIIIVTIGVMNCDSQAR